MPSPVRFASVVPLRKLPKALGEFTYRIPPTLHCEVGDLVRVPFQQHTEVGVVTALHDTAGGQKKIKDILAKTPLSLTKEQLKIAALLARYYYQSLATVFKSFLAPPPQREVHRVVNTQPAAANIRVRKIGKVSEQGYLFYLTYEDIVSYVAAYVKQYRTGQTLCIVPEHRTSAQLTALLAHAGLTVVALPPKQQKTEFFKAWERSKRAPLVIGSLSALFLPFRNLKRIVVLECEHQSFQRAEQNPRYHLADFIFAIARFYRAKLLLTGFSPDIRLLHEVMRLKLPLQRLGPSAPHGVVIDMTEEMKAGDILLSARVLDAMHRASGPLLLLYNRHGFARRTVCGDCGFHAVCEQCGRGLVFDSTENKLICLGCGRSHSVYLLCPRCGSPSIKTAGMGVSRIVKEVKKVFPNRSVIEFSQRRASPPHADIVVATNKIFSGARDRFSAAVVVNADLDLFLPNYHAAESLRHYIYKLRAFAPTVYVQTFHPEHYVFKTLHDLRDFYWHEIAWRKRLGYPPIKTLAKIWVRDSKASVYASKLRKLKEYFRALPRALPRVLPRALPYFGPFEQRAGRELRASILIRYASDDQRVLDVLTHAPYTWFQIEINPFELT